LNINIVDLPFEISIFIEIVLLQTNIVIWKL